MLLLLLQVPVGVYMAYRGNVLNVWDATTNALYSSHKLIGMGILLLVIARLAYRVVHGAPADEPTLQTWHKVASAFNHWGLYVSAVGGAGARFARRVVLSALDIFGIVSSRASWCRTRRPLQWCSAIMAMRRSR